MTFWDGGTRAKGDEFQEMGKGEVMGDEDQ
jgi:hypothetical protein